MALTQVRAPQQGQEVVGAKKGGGSTGAALGGIIGGAFGAVAGAATGGGGNIPGAVVGGIGGAAAGAGVGQKIGDIVQPGSQGTAIDRRVASQSQPEMYHSERSEQLRQSLAALQQQPPEMQKQYATPLMTAYINSLANDNAGHPLPGEQPQQPGVA